ncbi:branched-chain amino acid transport system II carrier protein [Shewanella profunda]|uniref:branched-chain amino acid transport system II carrier protein n=1 Tax=Shewanella profunda TaxID=254793 RepID=UPI00200FE4A4|nr:branched-chain amino acid transport system II carrier protein [Shewanella profunda]MCL1088196.1 branched-chain amino acid transport system II carrier protein [Shewanella profunda]
MGLPVQDNQMSIGDTLGLGFMTFAFFLGAGNLIFPPFAGMLAGDNMPLAMLGFLITAVGLPLVGLIAVAKAQGKVMAMLPVFAATALAIAIYMIIGPAFAAPRTGLVAYEIGAKPFIDNTSTTMLLGSLELNLSQLIYTLCFFTITMLLALFPGKLLDSVGKVLTPILLLLLVGLAASVLFLPASDVGQAVGDYQQHPLTKGILEGYNTMDTLASLMFGMLIIDILRKKGIEQPSAQTKYLIRAAFIAAAGLAFVYVSLFFLGATAGDIAAGAKNGGEILTNYVTHEFGSLGSVLLSSVVTLACLTTAVGLVSACSEFFNELLPKLSYRFLVVLLSVICAVVANVGLTQLIAISIPVLMTIYPVAIALVAVTFLTDYFANPQFAHRVTLSVALFFGIFDGLKVAASSLIGADGQGINALAQGFIDLVNGMAPALSMLPLYDEGMAWLLPTLIAIVLCLVFGRGRSKTLTAA